MGKSFNTNLKNSKNLQEYPHHARKAHCSFGWQRKIDHQLINTDMCTCSPNRDRAQFAIFVNKSSQGYFFSYFDMEHSLLSKYTIDGVLRCLVQNKLVKNSKKRACLLDLQTMT